MPRKPKRKFTADEIKLLETFAAVRLPEDLQAAHLGLSRGYLDELIKKDAAAQRAISAGRAKASMRSRVTLYERAVGREPQSYRDPATGELKWLPGIEVNQRALEFWLRTQEGFKTTDVVQFQDADGDDLRNKSDDELDSIASRLALRLGAGARRRGRNDDG